jgi:hypothetical protein
MTSEIKITSEQVIKLFNQAFDYPNTLKELMTTGGLTDRQRDTLLWLTDNRSIEEITLLLAERGGHQGQNEHKVFTFNTYEALNGAIKKYAHAVSLIMSLTYDENGIKIIKAIMNRVAEINPSNRPLYGVELSSKLKKMKKKTR